MVLDKYRKLYELKKAEKLLKKHDCFNRGIEESLRRKEKEYKQKGGKNELDKNK